MSPVVLEGEFKKNNPDDDVVLLGLEPALQTGGVECEKSGYLGGSEGQTKFPLIMLPDSEHFFGSDRHETLLVEPSFQKMNKSVNKYLVL